jgi:ankyrin repeat protein
MTNLDDMLVRHRSRGSGPIDWNILHRLIKNNPDQVNGDTLVRVLSVGSEDANGDLDLTRSGLYEGEFSGSRQDCNSYNNLYPSKSGSRNLIPWEILFSVLEACNYRVIYPWMAVGIAFYSEAMTPRIFQRFISENWIQGSTITLLARALALQPVPCPWSLLKTKLLWNRFPHALPTILCQSLRFDRDLTIIQAFIRGVDIEEHRGGVPTSSTKPSSFVPSMGTTYRDVLLSNETPTQRNILQELCFHQQTSVVQSLVHQDDNLSMSVENISIHSSPLLIPEDVVNFDLLGLAARQHNIDLELIKVLVEVNPSALGMGARTITTTYGNDTTSMESIKESVDIISNISSSSTKLPIHWACSGSNVKVLQYLLEEGINHNVGGTQGRGGLLLQDDDGVTALEVFFLHNRLSPFNFLAMVQYFIHADMNVQDQHQSNNSQREHHSKYIRGRQGKTTKGSMCSTVSPLLVRNDVQRFHLLHKVVRMSGNLDVIRLLMDLDPEAVCQPDSYGDLPLHLIRLTGHGPELLQVMVEYGLRDVQCMKKVELFSKENKDNISCLQMIFMEFRDVQGTSCDDQDENESEEDRDELFHSSPNRLTSRRKKDYEYRHTVNGFWKCLEILWNASHNVPFLQAAIGILPDSRIQEILHRFNCIDAIDQFGRLPLHYALDMKVTPSTLSMVLALNLDAASIPNQIGRYPIFMALQTTYYKKWTWIKLFVDVNPGVLERRDSLTGLFPFMFCAASSKGDWCEMELVYKLLRRAPHLVLIGNNIQKNTVSRKRKRAHHF